MAKANAPMSSKDYEADWDLDTLLRAAQIQKDPKRMAAVHKAAARRVEEKTTELAATKRLAKK